MTKNEYWQNYDYDSYDLCSKFAKDFDIWWSPNRFDWKYCSRKLGKYLLNKINIWYDQKKTNVDSINKNVNNLEWDYD